MDDDFLVNVAYPGWSKEFRIITRGEGELQEYAIERHTWFGWYKMRYNSEGGDAVVHWLTTSTRARRIITALLQPYAKEAIFRDC